MGRPRRPVERYGDRWRVTASTNRDEVPLAVQNTVKQMVDRAVQQNAFEACRELMESRIKNHPSSLLRLVS